MENRKYSLSDDTIMHTVESLRDYQLRLETEAAALFPFPDARALAEDRLEKAKIVKNLFEFYLQL